MHIREQTPINVSNSMVDLDGPFTNERGSISPDHKGLTNVQEQRQETQSQMSAQQEKNLEQRNLRRQQKSQAELHKGDDSYSDNKYEEL